MRIWIRLAFALCLAPLAAIAAEPEHVTLATLRAMPNAGVFLAQDAGYFRDEGIDLDVQWINAAQEAVMTVASGAADIGSGGITAGFYNLAGKGGLTLIGSTGREAPGFHNNGFVISNAAYDGGFRTLHDLPGHRCGVNTYGATQHYAIALIARKYDFPIDRVGIPQLQNFPNLVAAFKGGQVECIVATSTIAALLEAQKIGHVIGWSGDETPWMLGAIFARPQSIATRRPALVAYLRAYLRGAADYHAACNQRDGNGQAMIGPDCEAKLQILSKALMQPVEQLRDSITYIDPTGAMDLADIGNQLSFWQSQNMADPKAEAAKMVDQTLLRDAMAK